jgi:hypothetical protein
MQADEWPTRRVRERAREARAHDCASLVYRVTR